MAPRRDHEFSCDEARSTFAPSPGGAMFAPIAALALSTRRWPRGDGHVVMATW
jgi:hypothetical protein